MLRVGITLSTTQLATAGLVPLVRRAANRSIRPTGRARESNVTAVNSASGPGSQVCNMIDPASFDTFVVSAGHTSAHRSNAPSSVEVAAASRPLTTVLVHTRLPSRYATYLSPPTASTAVRASAAGRRDASTM